MQINLSEVGKSWSCYCFQSDEIVAKGDSTSLLTIRASLFSFRLSMIIPLTYSVRCLFFATIYSLALSFPPSFYRFYHCITLWRCFVLKQTSQNFHIYILINTFSLAFPRKLQLHMLQPYHLPWSISTLTTHLTFNVLVDEDLFGKSVSSPC